MKNLFAVVLVCQVGSGFAQVQVPSSDSTTSVDFQFWQNNKPVSVSGLTFQFRLLDSTGQTVAVFRSPLEVRQISDSKLKVLVGDEKVGHLPQNTYRYELVDVKGNTERVWQRGNFKITNGVGQKSTTVATQNERTNGDGDPPFISFFRREIDPTVGSHIKAITKQQISRWDSVTSLPRPISAQNFPSSYTIYQSDFANNISGVVALNGTATIQRQDGQLVVSNISGGAAIGFGDANKYREGQVLYVFLDFVKTSGDVRVTPRFGNPNGYLLNKTGKYYFAIGRVGTYPLGDFNVLVLEPVGATNSFTIGTLTVNDGGPSFDANAQSVKIGVGAKGDYNSVIIGKNATYNGNFRDGVLVGTNAQTDQQGSVIVGAEANGNHDGTFGCAPGNDQTVVGYAGRGYGWRTTALGAWSVAGGQSSTAIGAGAVTLTSHSVALGRGAFAANIPGLAGILTTDVRKIYFGNSYAHRYPAHPINNKDYEIDDPTTNPAAVEIEIHGQDALDARATPTDFNRAAGHLGLYAGRGTGRGVGGELRFYTAPTNPDTGQNDKNPAVQAGKFDASTLPADGTRFWLYDTQSGTMKRVRLAPPDAQNRKILYVDN